MKIRIKWFLFNIIILILILAVFLPARSQNLIIKGGYYFDAIGDGVQKNTVMVVVSGRFFCFGDIPENLDISNYKTLTLAEDDYILPGFFDMHAHFRVTFARKRWDETEVNPIIFLASFYLC